MKFVEEKIKENALIIDNSIIKVDSFLNHQIDVNFANEIGMAFAKEFDHVDKILTIETSGVAFAITTSQHLNNAPVVFARKSKSKIIDPSEVYMADIKSFTRGTVSQVTVSKRFLEKDENILIVDDFLAEGNASLGLIDIAKQAGAKILGVCTVINKVFQGGQEAIEKQGIKVVSGAIIKNIVDNKIIF